MSDGVVIPATGSAGTQNPQVATDEIAGSHHQLIKVEFGPDGTATPVTTTNPLPTAAPQPSAASVSVVAASTSTGPTDALAANTSRKGGLFFADIDAGSVYLKFGSAASTGLYTVPLLPGSYYELPRPVFTGSISALMLTTSTGGGLMVSELT